MVSMIAEKTIALTDPVHSTFEDMAALHLRRLHRNLQMDMVDRYQMEEVGNITLGMAY